MQRILSIKAKHLKDTSEQKLMLTNAEMTLNKRLNTETIRDEDLHCDQQFSDMKTYTVMANRSVVLTATLARQTYNEGTNQ